MQYPSQRLQDWLSQRWVMAMGRRVDPSEIEWLMGPYGYVDVIGDGHIDRLARDEGCDVVRYDRDAGLLGSMGDVVPGDDLARLHPAISAFYERTADYTLDIWSAWSPVFGLGGRMMRRLYSRRLRQLDLPQDPLDTARGMDSAVIRLIDRETGAVRHTAWHRVLKSSGQVVYSGYYGGCRPPGRSACMKVVFPLPRGNATVVLEPEVRADGGLSLHSRGERFGDPGFYFLLVDKKGRHFAQYVRSFRERIDLDVDDEGVLRTDHVLTLFRRTVLRLHYRITPRTGATEEH